MTTPSPDRPGLPETKGLSRRTVVKGMAWSVPVIAAASAVPAYAKTGTPPSIEVQDACKQPGNSCFKDFGFRKGYTFTVRIDNPNPETIYIRTSLFPIEYAPYLDISVGPNFIFENAAQYFPGTPPTTAPLGDSLEVPANGTVYVILNFTNSPNSANIPINGIIYLAWAHTPNPADDPDHDYSFDPEAEPPVPPGDGWVGGIFSFPATPPCGTDCLPGGDETETA